MLSQPIQLLPIGFRFARNSAENMWKYRACARWLVRVFSRLRSLFCFRVTSLLYARYSGPVEEGSRITQKTMLRFTWQLVAGEASQSGEVHLLCHHAARRGVHPPKHWKNELNLGLGQQTLDALADSAMQRFRGEFALSDAVKLDCRLLFTHAHTFVLVFVDVCMCCMAGTLESAVLLRLPVLI